MTGTRSAPTVERSDAQSVRVPVKVRRATAASVRRGARLLDKNRPGWFNRVKTTKLRMDHRCQCVFGQLEAHYLLEELRYETHGYIPPLLAGDWARNHQFFQAYDAIWVLLQEEWLRQIRDRRIAQREARKAAA